VGLWDGAEAARAAAVASLDAAAAGEDEIHAAWEANRTSLTQTYKRAYRKMLAKKRRRML
jgi:hypothetical protein